MTHFFFVREACCRFNCSD